MSRQVIELDSLLQQLVAEHRKLLTQLEAQQLSMRRMDAQGIENASRLQEAARARITHLEQRRQWVIGQIANLTKVAMPLKIEQIAKLFPGYGPSLLKHRDELRGLAAEILKRSTIVGRLATAVLGQLNTIVRGLAGVVNQGGVYTKQGLPKVATRIGAMEAIG
jgi:hypothetical protein